LLKDNAPKDLKCTEAGCNGTLVRKPDEQFRGHYASPECDTCSKVYPLATNVPKLPRTKKVANR